MTDPKSNLAVKCLALGRGSPRRLLSVPRLPDLVAKVGSDETPLGPRKVAQGQRHTQAEIKPTSLTLHISLLEARDLALGRGSPPVCTEAHRISYVSSGAHLLRALTFGLPNREVLYMNLKSTFRGGRLHVNYLRGRSKHGTLEEHVSLRA